MDIKKDEAGNPIVEKTAEQIENDRLFDAAVGHLEANPAQAFDVKTAQPRDDGGKFAKKSEGETEETEEQRKAREDAEKKASDDAAAAQAAAAKGPDADTDALAALGLPDEALTKVRAILDKESKKAAEAEALAKRHASQVAGYERNLKEARDQAARAKQAGDPAAQAKAAADAKKANEALEALRKDYPNIAAAIDAAAKGAEERVRKEMGAQIDALNKQVAPAVKSATDSAIAAEEATIAGKHPGWTEEIKTPQFTSWFKEQPPEVQVMAKGSAAAEIRLLDLYRVDHPAETPEQIAAREKAEAARTAADALATRRAKQARDAAGPGGKRTPAPVGTNPDDGDEERAKANLFNAAVDQVMREFRVPVTTRP